MKSKYSSFIKLFVSIVIVSSALLIQSCSNSESENLSDQSLQSTVPQNSVFRVYDKTYNTPKGLQIWEAQLNKTIEMDSNMVRDGLKLIRYEYVRQIASTTDLETVKTELKKDNSLFIVYKDNSAHFSISENKEYAAKYSNLIDSLLPTSAGILEAIRAKGDTSLLAKAAYAFKKKDIGVVNLVWEYKGKTLNTRCLVSNEKGIVYDKFLFSIRATVSQITSVPSTSFKAPQIEHRDNDPVSKNWRRGWIVYTVYGYEAAKCWVEANIYGIWGDGIGHATGFSTNQYTSSITNEFYFSVFIVPTDFARYERDTNNCGHLTVAYGIIGGYSNDVNVIWNGNFPVWTGNAVIQEASYVSLDGHEMN